MKKIFFFIMIAMLSVMGFAQNISSSDAVKSKDIQTTIIEILTKANNNYEGMIGTEVNKGETYIMYLASSLPKMYAQKYYITNVLSNNRNYYVAYYSVPQNVQLAKKAIMDMPKFGGSDWKLEKENNNVPTTNTTNFYYKNAKVAQLREDNKAKVLSLSIGFFDNVLNSTKYINKATSKTLSTEIRNDLNAFVMPTRLADGSTIPDYCAKFGLPPIQQVAKVLGSNKQPHHIDAPGTAGIKSYGSNFADTLMYLHSIANYDFEGFVSRKNKSYYPYVEYFVVPPIFNTDRVYCNYNYNYGLKLTISFVESNRVEQALKDIKTFFETFVKSDARFTTKTIDNEVYMRENGNDFFEYYSQSFDKHHKPKDLQIVIFSTPNYSPVNEATYKGHFPSSVMDSWDPQIWEIKGKGFTLDSYQHFNGLFTDGKLQYGEKTFHGYGPFYDGKWYGSWSGEKSLVAFIPEGINDTLGGKFEDSTMTDFTLDNTSSLTGEYDPSFKNVDKNNNWIKNGYAAYIVKKVDLRNKAFAKHNAEAEERIEYRRTHPTENSIENTRPVQNNSICICCHGTGKVSKYDPNNMYQTYDHGTKVGDLKQSRDVTCSCCHGTGH